MLIATLTVRISLDQGNAKPGCKSDQRESLASHTKPKTPSVKQGVFRRVPSV